MAGVSPIRWAGMFAVTAATLTVWLAVTQAAGSKPPEPEPQPVVQEAAPEVRQPVSPLPVKPSPESSTSALEESVPDSAPEEVTPAKTGNIPKPQEVKPDPQPAHAPIAKPVVKPASKAESKAPPKVVPKASPKTAPKSTVVAKPKPVAKSQTTSKSKKSRIKLFGTVEFKGKIRKLPKWSRVLDKMQAWKGYFKSPDTARLPSKSGWQKLKKETRSMDVMGRLKATNKFFNQWPYRLDAANYGKSDYWAAPNEFLKKSGDCEDYSIAKFYALQELGFSGDQMRVVALKDSIRNIGHAVLVVYVDNEAYVLDNQTNMVLPHSRYKHYVPQYSVNEKFRWMHVPVTKKRK